MRRAALLLAVLSGCSKGPADKAFPSDARDVMRSATIVEAIRVHVPEGKDRQADWFAWTTKTGPVALDASRSKRLVDVLLDNATYYTGPPKACLPMPGVKYRFVQGTRSVAVMLCYECRQLFGRFSWGGGGFGDFDHGAPVLEEIAKQLFPSDGEIQSLTGLGTPAKAGPWKDLATGIQTATAVEAWRIAGKAESAGTYFDYQEVEGPVPLDKKSVSALVAALSDPKAVREAARPCSPSPGVKLKFTRPDPAPVWVFLCFECNELSVWEAKAEHERRLFDDARPALLAVLKPLFPRDEGIQHLK
jgi:hypothetical protein